MEVKAAFGILALLLILQQLLRWLIGTRVMAKRMTPAEILHWRLMNHEIDAGEYEVRRRKLRQMINSALNTNKAGCRKGEQR